MSATEVTPTALSLHWPEVAQSEGERVADYIGNSMMADAFNEALEPSAPSEDELSSSITRLKPSQNTRKKGLDAKPKKAGTPSISSVVKVAYQLPENISIYKVSNVHNSFVGSYNKDEYIVVDDSNKQSDSNTVIFGRRMSLQELEFGEVSLMFNRRAKPVLVLKSDLLLVGHIKKGKVSFKTCVPKELKNIRKSIVPEVH
ncbi:hypothetical protein L1D14_10460 [Vibrio tubiashii]|uniref:hypothetical protein n=1 Tax=Vibrio tubiashii TaxID=29498 RepID=UPI001EFE6419|nr:hypothetical protein [Vibrio tubiashii]MCG9576659.1 hypothetical protein [Vibrio tubiashii]